MFRVVGRCLSRGVLLILVCAAVAPGATAEVFYVTNVLDAIPAPPGSLRWAVEASEANNVPDEIVFIVDGGTIQLVAPLPDLTRGDLSIGRVPELSPSIAPAQDAAITIDGSGLIPRAISVFSGRNRIGGLQFTGFAGDEVILIRGGSARDNVVGGCLFGDDASTSPNAGAGVRVAASALAPGTPSGTEVRLCRFVGNAAGVVIEGDGVLDPDVTDGTRLTTIRGNEFGTDAAGGAGPGTGRVIHSTGAGGLRIEGNRFSGPGLGIHLGSGSHGSTVSGNAIGLRASGAELCSGFTGPALYVEDSSGVVIRENSLLCSEFGIYLGPSARSTRVGDNVIGGGTLEGHVSHGIVLESAEGSVIRHNRITGNGGNGVAMIPGPGSEPSLSNVLACNSVHRNALQSFSLPGVTTLPPLLQSASALAVAGELPNSASGWVELFGDDTTEARLFQGSVRSSGFDPGFRHLLPVLGLFVVKENTTGAGISWDLEIPANHTATVTDETLGETSELSLPIASVSGPLYDVIRGSIANLAFGPDGGIDLGPVVCLASGIDPDISVTPFVTDDDPPSSGEAYFYLARRRVNDVVQPGTYDPAICLTEIDAFGGSRAPSAGDCPN